MYCVELHVKIISILKIAPDMGIAIGLPQNFENQIYNSSS